VMGRKCLGRVRKSRTRRTDKENIGNYQIERTSVLQVEYTVILFLDSSSLFPTDSSDESVDPVGVV
jgi:hypothetical protein